MSSPQGYASARNIITFISDDETDFTATGFVGVPNTEDLGTKASEEGATKLVSLSNRLRGIVTLGTIDKISNSIEFFIFGNDASERIPGIASTQQFTLGWVMHYTGGAGQNSALADDTAANIFNKWRLKVPGDYIEGAIITTTAASGAATQAVTGIQGTNFSMDFFKGHLSGTSFNFGSQSEPGQMNFTVDLSDPIVTFLDAQA